MIRRNKLPEASYTFLRSEEEVRRFLRAALHHVSHQGQRSDLDAPCERRLEEHLDVHALYATAVYTGMRLGELAALRWDAVDLDRRLITVHRSHDGPTKGGEIRHVPILDPLLPILRAWKLHGGTGLVFTATNGGVLKKDSRVFQEVMARVLECGGFEKGYITFHDLRHTFASHWMIARAIVKMPATPRDRARWLLEEVERLALAELSQPARVPASGLRSEDGGSL